MTPYKRKEVIGGATLMNCDCMEYMATLPDKAFDLAVVDPEYGINLKGPCGHFEKYGTLQSINENPPSNEYFLELFRISARQIIWGGNYFVLPPSRCFIVWDKGASMTGRSFAECEQAWCGDDDVARIVRVNPNQANRFHPTQKPVKLYEWLLTNYAKPGQRILDTHLGSMSSVIAALNMGFEITGCELDADYFEAGCNRVRDAQRQERMFA